MPRPPGHPHQGLWRMGVSLWVTKWWKCRSINAVIFMVCLWVSLITVVNITTNGGGSSSWTLKYETFQSGQTTFSDTADLSSDHRAKSRSRHASATLNVRAHLKTSAHLSREGSRQTGSSIESGIISGRRMQEIKAVEMEGLETVSRVQDHEDRDRGNILISAGRDRIDRKAITAGEIRPNLPTPEKNPNDLLPNWTLEPEWGRSSSSLSNVFKSRSREKSKLDRVISSRAKGSLSEPDSHDRKTRSGVSEQRAVSWEMSHHEQSDITTRPDIIEQADISRQRDGSLTRGLDRGENPASSHLRESIDSTRNRHSNFDDRASHSRGEIKIDTLLNGSTTYTTREIEVSTYSYGSRTLDNAGTHLASPPASEKDSVRSTHSLKEEYRQSNRGVPVAMQILVPYRNNDSSSSLHKVVDTKGHSSATQINSRPRYPTLFHDLYGTSARPHGPVDPSLGGGTSHLNPPQADNMLNASILSANVTSEIRLSTELQPETNQTSSSDTFSASLNSYLMTYSRADLSGNKARSAKGSHGKLPQEPLLNDGFDLYSYNVTASNLISLDRSLPDTRPEGSMACRFIGLCYVSTNESVNTGS
ncbi:hypothetical protein Btru_027472 [Bulinus truncatus]|nr:hypothetical protein Btru_027472 [Bulinus truncatus]